MGTMLISEGFRMLSLALVRDGLDEITSPDCVPIFANSRYSLSDAFSLAKNI